jgi:hypothetical protein
LTRRALRWLVPLAAVALLLAVGLAHLASGKPDGLERVAEQQGFSKKEKVTATSPMPNYEVSALGGPIGKTLAGLAGVLLTFSFVLGVGRLLARQRRSPRGAALDRSDASPGPDA